MTSDSAEKLDIFEEILQDLPESILEALKSRRDKIRSGLTKEFDRMKTLTKAHNKLTRSVRTRWNMFSMNDNIVGSVESHIAQSSSMRNVVYLFNLLTEYVIPMAIREEKFARLGAPQRGLVDFHFRDKSDRLSNIRELIKLRSSSRKWNDGLLRWDYRKIARQLPCVSMDDYWSNSATVQHISAKSFLRNLEAFAFSDILGQSNLTLWEASSAIQIVLDPMNDTDKVIFKQLLDELKSTYVAHNADIVIIPTSSHAVGSLLAAAKEGVGKIDYFQVETIFSNLSSVKDESVRMRADKLTQEIQDSGISPFTVFVNGRGFRLDQLKNNENNSVQALCQAIKEQIEMDLHTLAMGLLVKMSPFFMITGGGFTSPGQGILQRLGSPHEIVKLLTSHGHSDDQRISPEDMELLEELGNDDNYENNSFDNLQSSKVSSPTLEDYYLSTSASGVFNFVGNSGQVFTIGDPKIDSTTEEFPRRYPIPLEILNYLNTLRVTGIHNDCSSNHANKTLDIIPPLSIIIIVDDSASSPNMRDWTYRCPHNVIIETCVYKARLHEAKFCVDGGDDNKCILLNSRLPMNSREDEFLVLAGGLVAHVPNTVHWRSHLSQAITSLVELHTSFLHLSILSCERRRILTGSYPAICLQNVNITELRFASGAAQLWYEEHTNAVLNNEFDSNQLLKVKTMTEVFEKTSLRHLRLSATQNDPLTKLLSIKAIVDPLSKWGQQIIPVVKYLYKYLHADVRLLLNPDWKYTSLPINRWARTVMYPPLMESFFHNVTASMAAFNSVQTNETLVMSLETPEHWITRSLDRELDTDNVRWKDVVRLSCNTGGFHHVAEYDLHGFYVEGYVESFERQHDKLSRSDKLSGGHSLRLTQYDKALAGLNSTGVVFDTFSMYPTGYFQFPTNGGIGKYGISLINTNISLDRSDSKSPVTEIAHYNVQSLAESTSSGESYVVVKSYRPVSTKISIVADAIGTSETTKKDIVNKQSLVSKALLMMKKNLAMSSSEASGSNERVHIFSLASGHMYERLLRIMMISVRENTKRPITFWILNNFLSAKFRESAEHFASKLDNVTINYVSYKWPQFLRPQVEKQRQIWANKILFLDVLFPLSVKKIIYIDADQIVRGDIGELWDMDLNGHVYGFTPFCSDREETAHLRFWEQGYWKDHLSKKQYHISALFVVDLELFRQRQIGSQLRVIYNGLSADPNSLSNLDQDLPNYAQHQIPIFSLPPEWLWCETWCSDQKKNHAKTIDLCNNPLTHEPKLSQAKRIAPEWSTYDAMVTSYLNMTAEAEQSTVFRLNSSLNHHRELNQEQHDRLLCNNDAFHDEKPQKFDVHDRTGEL